MSDQRETVYACIACGRISPTTTGEGVCGWGVSCYLNAILVYKDMVVIVDGYVKHIPTNAIVPGTTNTITGETT